MSGEFPEEAIAHMVMATANGFRDWLSLDSDPEVMFVGVATLITDLSVQLGKATTPMRAAQMLMHQMELLFEEFPGLKRELMADQIRRYMSQPRP